MTRVGFTTRAHCLIAAGSTALAAGLLLGILDLARAGVLALAVPALSGLLVARTRVQVTNRRRVDPSRLGAGGAVTVHLELSNGSRFASGPLMLEDRLPTQLRGSARFVLDGLNSRQTRTVSYRMPRLPRGRYRVGPLSLRLTDPFHLVDVRRSFSSTAEVVVTPVIESVRAAQAPRSSEAGDDAGSHAVGARGADDASTREYRVGDDLRKIHWRSSARTGTFMVRQEERPWQGQYRLLLDRRGGAHASRGVLGDDETDARDTNSMEWAISAAASLGTHALATGRDVVLLDDPGQPLGSRFTDPVHLADHLAVVGPAGYGPLATAGGLSPSVTRDATLVAVLGRLRPEDLHVLAGLPSSGVALGAAALVLDVASWSYGVSMPATPSAEATDAARALGAAGWHVVIVRCGEHVGDSLRRLLAFRAAGTARAAVR